MACCQISIPNLCVTASNLANRVFSISCTRHFLNLGQGRVNSLSWYQLSLSVGRPSISSPIMTSPSFYPHLHNQHKLDHHPVLTRSIEQEFLHNRRFIVEFLVMKNTNENSSHRKPQICRRLILAPHTQHKQHIHTWHDQKAMAYMITAVNMETNSSQFGNIIPTH